MKILILGRNEFRASGFYSQDWIDAFEDLYPCKKYGPGYQGYCQEDDIFQIIRNLYPGGNGPDLIVCNSSWDSKSEDSVDPHPGLGLDNIRDIPKVYFLNKEYKNLDLRVEYANKNKFDAVVTVNERLTTMTDQILCPVWVIPFAVNLKRFNKKGQRKRYDFGFTGSLHSAHLKERSIAKRKILKPSYHERLSNLNWYNRPRRSASVSELNQFDIFWQEFGSKNLLGRSALPIGDKYTQFLPKFHAFLNTRSAAGIINPRFFELMASGAVNVCPVEREEYNGMFIDGVNCIYIDVNEEGFVKELAKILENKARLAKIAENAFSMIQEHTYQRRVEELMKNVRSI